MILTDDECRDIYNTAMEAPVRSAVSVTRAIEQDVIRKLAAGVSVEPEQVAARWPSVPGSHHYAGAGKCQPNSFGPDSEDLFTRSQLNTAIAAARVQENERCVQACAAKSKEYLARSNRDQHSHGAGLGAAICAELLSALLGKEPT